MRFIDNENSHTYRFLMHLLLFKRFLIIAIKLIIKIPNFLCMQRKDFYSEEGGFFFEHCIQVPFALIKMITCEKMVIDTFGENESKNISYSFFPSSGMFWALTNSNNIQTCSRTTWSDILCLIELRAPKARACKANKMINSRFMTSW